MPALLIPIAVFIGSIIRPLIARILLALGLGVVTYVGGGSLIDAVKDEVINQFGGLSADLVNLLSTLQVDKCVTVLLSAYAVRFALSGLKTGSKAISHVTGN